MTAGQVAAVGGLYLDGAQDDDGVLHEALAEHTAVAASETGSECALYAGGTSGRKLKGV